jgi:hypothetical protein
MSDLSPPSKSAQASQVGSVFERVNYVWMGAGLLLLVLGFVLMAGGASDDPQVFDADAVYSFRRITLAPILVLLGYALQIVAIFRGRA